MKAVVDTGTVIYTPNTEFSPNSKSKFTIPTETGIDNEYNITHLYLHV